MVVFPPTVDSPHFHYYLLFTLPCFHPIGHIHLLQSSPIGGANLIIQHGKLCCIKRALQQETLFLDGMWIFLSLYDRLSSSTTSPGSSFRSCLYHSVSFSGNFSSRNSATVFFAPVFFPLMSLRLNNFYLFEFFKVYGILQ